MDCKDMCLIVLSSRTKYLALSYVWGRTPALQTTKAELPILSRPGASTPRLGQLSNTVEETIAFVQQCGQRYLWLDQFCIVQDTLSEKELAIENMDKVYRSVHTVLIAAAGSDASAGLLGLKNRLRARTEFFKKGIVTAGERDLLGESLEKGIYDTGGWAYVITQPSRFRTATNREADSRKIPGLQKDLLL